jgi:hypothetical protein
MHASVYQMVSFLRFFDLYIICILHLPHAFCMHRPSHSPLFYTLIVSGEVYKLRSSPLCIFLQYSVTSCAHLGSNILLSTPFPNTFSRCSSHNVRDQVSNPYRTTECIKSYISYECILFFIVILKYLVLKFSCCT